ncbi:hypothetical protein IHE55_01200 [Streptomyces pactum]|uniref:DUF8129 domain-containing protein n=1 Tax=Streptomyces pactum TaxID=68249 RepID=A0ABS0NE96_9ACTN|nr:hypothetical protein [Streptomyces pactum]MBH5333492.1 hypothetical protein [Streptomyces pactum]
MNDRRSDELPLADYDRLAAGDLGHRIRSLGTEELETLLRYEREHARRAGALQVLTARLEQLKRGATPSPGGESATTPPGDSGASGGSPVSPQTAAEPVHPPPHGTPAQPAKPKGDAMG